MSSDNLELASNHLQAMRTVLRQFKTAASAASPAADKLDKLKTQFTNTDAKVSKLLAGAVSGREWEALKKDVKATRDEFQRLDRAVSTKQSAAQNDMNRASSGADEGGANGGGAHAGSKLGLGHATVVNTAPLDTEEALQRERLEGVVEIEGQMGELKSMYQDFNTLVHDQQAGLDMTEQNVDKSTKHVERGVVELKKASEVQKSSRKWMCALIVIIALAALGGAIYGFTTIGK
jgi:hypothetical protein